MATESENWTFDTIQKFVDSATKEEVSALQDTFERQADLMRRHEKDESAAFWETLSKGIAAAANRGRAGEALRKRDAV
jgi:murein L,D-transpeptidase YafK